MATRRMFLILAQPQPPLLAFSRQRPSRRMALTTQSRSTLPGIRRDSKCHSATILLEALK